MRVKNFASIFGLALAAGLNLQMRRKMHRATSVKVRRDRFLPHEGKREVARRARQIERGMHNTVFNERS